MIKLQINAGKLLPAFFLCRRIIFYACVYAPVCIICRLMISKNIIITIDGWSSCGKSTLAKQLAEALNYVYIDSGAMYRAITLYFLRNTIDWKKEKAVKEALENIQLEFRTNESTKKTEMYLNDENVEYIIRDYGSCGKGKRGSSYKAGA